jgi:murein L,D-transpeptidase YcbB/YkuD
MKKIFLLIIFLALPLTGCAIFEVEGLKDKVDVLDERVTSIEDQLGQKEESVTYVSKVKIEEAKPQVAADVSMTNREIQIALSNAGYYDGSVDGKLGPKSRRAIKGFQGDNGLKVDGVAGPETQRVLIRYLTK